MVISPESMYHKGKMKWWMIPFAIMVLGLAFPLRNQPLPPQPPITPEPETATVLLVGDIMLDRGVHHYIKQNNDWSWPFREIADFLRKGDIVFGNLESMISDQGHDVGSIYSFRADPRTMAGLELAGFNVLSVANNHSFDYTRAAFQDTLNRLNRAGIEYVGGGFSQEEAHSPAVLTIGQTRFGFLGYTAVGSPLWQARDDVPGIAWMDHQTLDTLQRDIEKAKEQTDILTVSFHFGQEYQTEPDDRQRILAEAAIDFGADLVVGHHPHVLQPLERYRNGWIAYSLGNFVFDQSFSRETMEAAILKIKTINGRIDQAELIPTALTDQFQVKLKYPNED